MAFDAHCKGICEALAPVGALEIDIAQAIAENRWRLKRARAMETGIFAAGQQGLLGFNPGVGATEDADQLLIEDALIQARTWLTKNDIFCFSRLMSSASTAPLRGIWPNSAPCGPDAKRPAIKPSKKPCF
jgi:hypothetical protein